MRWFWGLIIVLIGILILGNNLHWWNNAQWQNLWYFWPVLLILFGAGLIVKRWRFGWIINIICLIVAVFFIYALILAPKPVFNLKLSKQNLVTTPIEAAIPEGINKANLTVDCGAINFNLKGDSPQLITGQMTSNIVKPKLNISTVNNRTDIKITMEKIANRWYFSRNTLDLNLSNQLPWTLKINCGASTTSFNLSNLQIENLEYNAGASTAKFRIGQNSLDQATFKFNMGASSLDILYPKDFGVDLNIESPLSSRNFSDFNKISTNHYQTKNFLSATKHINIAIKSGASSINISSY